MGRQHFKTSKCAVFIVYAAALVMLVSHRGVDAKRNLSNSQRKPSSSSGSGHVTPSYNTQGGSSSGNSHADVAKLSYPNYNSQPNPNPAHATNSNPPQIGWNVPNQHGPPPAYSASNTPTGARTNIHEQPPSYQQPGYPGSNVHTPITASNTQGTQFGAPPAGATYHAPGALPAGATYYPSNAHVPSGGSYYPPGGHMPAGPGYYPGPGAMPAGATYYPSNGALPPGATYYAQPPQSSSSGLGFGTGLIAGGLGGALLGHALTPSQTHVEQAPAPGGAAAGNDRIIIINNGVPANVTGDGATVINAGAVPAQMANATQETATPAPLAPMVPVAGADNNTAAAQPPAGGIICVPVRVNETDPNDSSKMIEVEKIACYPAPPAAAAEQPTAQNSTSIGGTHMAPNAQSPMLPPDQAAVRVNKGTGGKAEHYAAHIFVATLLASCLIMFDRGM